MPLWVMFSVSFPLQVNLEGEKALAKCARAPYVKSPYSPTLMNLLSFFVLASRIDAAKPPATALYNLNSTVLDRVASENTYVEAIPSKKPLTSLP